MDVSRAVGTTEPVSVPVMTMSALVGSMSLRELICALSALEDARRRCGVSTPAEREVAVALAADERRVLDELRRRRASAVQAAAGHPDTGRVGAGAESEGARQG